MTIQGRRQHGLALLAIITMCGACAQDIEPRSYANAPVGVNFVLAGGAFTRFGFPTDPALPLEDPKLNTSTVVLGYARVISILGKCAKLSLASPYTFLNGSARFNNEPLSRVVSGFNDAKLRLSVNLVGAPAMNMEEFVSYKQDLIIGVGVLVSAPTGQYDGERLVNIGANRWSFKGEVGASKALDKWILELSVAGELFTTNADFYIGNERAQEPIGSVKGHAIRTFSKGRWASVDATYYGGGTTVINGTQRNDLQQNWRVGGTIALPVSKRNSIKLYASSGVYARTGNNFDMAGVVWQYRWGAGL